MESMSAPCIIPSFSMTVYKNPEQRLLNRLTKSNGSADVVFVQPCVAIYPSLESIAISTFSLGSFDNNSSFAAVPIMIFFAPYATLFM